MNKYVLVAVVCAFMLQGSTNEYAIQPLSLNVHPDKNGQFTAKQNFGATRWEKGTVVPPIEDGVLDPTTQKPVLKWPILAYYPNAWYPSIVWYYDGSFRASNGYKWGTPARWSYVRWWQESWDGTKNIIPGAVVKTTDPVVDKPGVHMDDIAGQQMIDILKRSFTNKRIQDFMDASPYDEPDKGAPLE